MKSSWFCTKHFPVRITDTDHIKASKFLSPHKVPMYWLLSFFSTMCCWDIKLIKKEKSCRLFRVRLGIVFLHPVTKCSIYDYRGLHISMLQLIPGFFFGCLLIPVEKALHLVMLQFFLCRIFSLRKNSWAFQEYMHLQNMSYLKTKN